MGELSSIKQKKTERVAAAAAAAATTAAATATTATTAATATTATAATATTATATTNTATTVTAATTTNATATTIFVVIFVLKFGFQITILSFCAGLLPMLAPANNAVGIHFPCTRGKSPRQKRSGVRSKFHQD